MRTLAFIAALLILGWCGFDFWSAGRRQLIELPDLRDQVRAGFTDGIGRARALGAPPPRASEVEEARRTAAACRAERAELTDRWFAGARTAADYLEPRATRPRAAGNDAVRARLEELLLVLPSDLKSLPGGSIGRLGLLTPSLTRTLELEGAEFSDQLERAIVASFLAATRRLVPRAAIEQVAAVRNGAGELELQVALLGSLEDAVAFGEALLAASDAVPPRRLMQYRLRRLQTEEWTQRDAELAAPPVAVALAVAFRFPSSREEAPR
ncbi:MAG: hypothetical protein JNL90_08740 [Planctomycetes bacterium]|nr:hypothetical protein [Planctomycetota bacterium]